MRSDTSVFMDVTLPSKNPLPPALGPQEPGNYSLSFS